LAICLCLSWQSYERACATSPHVLPRTSSTQADMYEYLRGRKVCTYDDAAAAMSHPNVSPPVWESKYIMLHAVCVICIASRSNRHSSLLSARRPSVSHAAYLTRTLPCLL
jgi:hypothetical protein